MCFIKNQITESVKVIQDIEHLEIDIKNVSKQIVNCIKNGTKIIVFGNGGSAADAQHLATELMGGMTDHDRKPIPSIALTTDSSFLTAWSNDCGFESIFSRQIQGIGNDGDVLIGISTSGNSKNIIKAIKQAKYKKLKTIVFTGESGGDIDGLADLTIKVPSSNTQRIQESHIMIGQILCSILEQHFMEN